MCDAARAMHDAREAVKTAAKEKKSAEGLATLRAAQIAYSKQLDAARKAQEERRREERAAAAAEVRADEAARADEPSPKARPKPPSAKSVTFAPGTTPSDGQRREARSAVVPTVFELQQSKRYACASVSLPDTASLATMAAASVVCADAIGGIGAWGDGAGTWAAPHRWIPLVEKLNRAYNLAPDREDGSSTRHVLGMKLRNGEYNMVFFPERDVEPEIDLPPLVDGSGRVLAPHEVVFRVTRPDASVQHNGDPFYRYKPFKAIQREFYYTLHGAAHDYAPPCLAAILYPAVLIVNKDGSTETLYGALYVLHRASKDLVSLLDDETTRLREAHAGRTQLPAYAGALRKAGSKAALWLLPVLVRQAKLGALSFDAKPANYVFGADGKPYAIDFDAGMYSVSNDARVQWHAGLLMLVRLLTAHVRLYSAPALADGWAGALRPLVLELCAGARGARWLFDARVVNREVLRDHVRHRRGRAPPTRDDDARLLHQCQAVRRRTLPPGQRRQRARPYRAAVEVQPARLRDGFTGSRAGAGAWLGPRPAPLGGSGQAVGGRAWEPPRTVCRPNCVAFVNNQPPPESGNDRGTCSFCL